MANKIIVPDIETGRKMLEEVQKEMQEAFAQLAGKHGEDWQKACDHHYEVRNKKREIQNQLTKLVHQKMRDRQSNQRSGN